MLVCAPVAHSAAGQQGDKKMGNADVIALANAGLNDDIIIAKIRASSSTDFDTGVDSLKALQAAHVSNAIIQAMIDPHHGANAMQPPAAGASSTSNSSDPDAPHSPGIYLYATAANGHTMTELQRAQPKQTKGNGAFLSGMTYGITKAKIRAVLEGANALVKTADPNPLFYLYAPESQGAFGGSYIKPNDFTLVKLTQKNDTREIVDGSAKRVGIHHGNR